MAEISGLQKDNVQLKEQELDTINEWQVKLEQKELQAAQAMEKCYAETKKEGQLAA
jgi:hypothetical protein